MEDFYELGLLIPPEKEGLGQWGYGVKIKDRLALRARESALTEEVFDNLDKKGRIIIQRYFGEYANNQVRPPYSFVDKSFLLKSVDCPGNSCNLYLTRLDDFTGSNFEQKRKSTLKLIEDNQKDYLFGVEYGPHNVDSMIQAFCLQTLWLNWAKCVGATFSEEGLVKK